MSCFPTDPAVAAIAREVADVDEPAAQEWSREASGRFAEVTSIDIDVYQLKVAHSSASINLILRTDSVVVAGTESFSRETVRIDADELATLWSVRLSSIVPGYLEAVHRATDSSVLRRWSRLVGKDIMKCWRTRLIEEEAVFYRSIEELHKELVRRWPAARGHFDALWMLYRYPTHEKRKIEDALRGAEAIYQSV